MLSIRNYFGLMGVFGGLTQFAVSRLKLTWAHVHKDILDQWKKIESLCSPLGNFRNLRAHMDASGSPQLRAPRTCLHLLSFTL